MPRLSDFAAIEPGEPLVARGRPGPRRPRRARPVADFIEEREEVLAGQWKREFQRNQRTPPPGLEKETPDQ